MTNHHPQAPTSSTITLGIRRFPMHQFGVGVGGHKHSNLQLVLLVVREEFKEEDKPKTKKLLQTLFNILSVFL